MADAGSDDQNLTQAQMAAIGSALKSLSPIDQSAIQQSFQNAEDVFSGDHSTADMVNAISGLAAAAGTYLKDVFAPLGAVVNPATGVSAISGIVSDLDGLSKSQSASDDRSPGMTSFSLVPFSRMLIVVGLVSAGAAAFPIRCFAACNQPMSTVEESQCAQAAADKAAQTMQKSLNRALADAGKMIGNGNTVDFRPQISESQGVWEKWKEAQCKLEADLTMGSAGAYALPQCRQRLIIDRTKSLDDIAKQLETLL